MDVPRSPSESSWTAGVTQTVMNPVRLNLGEHKDLPSEALLPYRLLCNLGLGASAAVEKVEDAHTGQVYARKVFRDTNTRHIQEVKGRFLNEIQIMRKLKHRHFVRLVASYTCGRALGIVLEPVADGGDLGSFLAMLRDRVGPPTGQQSQILTHAFGCLASGLSFMHDHTIRHKDIKPQNILIHRGSVLYTDFGISRDFAMASHSTTMGTPGAFSRRYAAPEVVDWDKRNRKSDIFSLGCVYLEILTTLKRDMIPDSILNCCYHQVIENVNDYLANDRFRATHDANKNPRHANGDPISSSTFRSQRQLSFRLDTATSASLSDMKDQHNELIQSLRHPLLPSTDPTRLDIANDLVESPMNMFDYNHSYDYKTTGTWFPDDLAQADELAAPKDACCHMISRDPSMRPSADKITAMLLRRPWSWEFEDDISFFCPHCRHPLEENFLASGRADCNTDELLQCGGPSKTPAKDLSWIELDGYKGFGPIPRHPEITIFPAAPDWVCDHCEDFPEGFQGSYELQRHVNRCHSRSRKMWICVDGSTEGTFLSNCKSCQGRKQYGAYYNAAAHLRRAHFNPRKQSQGSKKEEQRRVSFGGKWPPLQFLKENYIREVVGEAENASDSDSSSNAIDEPYVETVLQVND